MALVHFGGASAAAGAPTNGSAPQQHPAPLPAHPTTTLAPLPPAAKHRLARIPPPEASSAWLPVKADRLRVASDYMLMGRRKQFIK